MLITENRKGKLVAKITDFGISRDLFEEQTIEQSLTAGIGTAHYMAPEQFFKKNFGLNKEVTSRTDLWAIGVIVFRILTNKLPFGHNLRDMELIRDEIVHSNPDLTGLSNNGIALVKNSLLKNAAFRPESGLELWNIYHTGKITEAIEKEWIKQAKEKVADISITQQSIDKHDSPTINPETKGKTIKIPDPYVEGTGINIEEKKPERNIKRIYWVAATIVVLAAAVWGFLSKSKDANNSQKQELTTNTNPLNNNVDTTTASGAVLNSEISSQEPVEEEKSIPIRDSQNPDLSEESTVKNTTRNNLENRESTSGQIEKKEPEETEQVFTIVDEQADFPGGNTAWNDYLKMNLNYPQEARTKGIEGAVLASFVVDKKGSISDISIIRGIDGGCNEEVIRLLRTSPKWNPAKKGGKPVNSKMQFRIVFKLNSSNSTDTEDPLEPSNSLNTRDESTISNKVSKLDEKKSTFETVLAEPYSTNSLTFLNEKNRFVLGKGNVLETWNIDTRKKELTYEGHKSRVSTIAAYPDSRWNYPEDTKYIASGTVEGELILWDAKTGEVIKRRKAHDSEITSISFSLGGTIATTSLDKTLRFWDSPQLKKLKEKEIGIHSDEPLSIGLFETGDFVTFSKNGQVIVWTNHVKTTKQSSNLFPKQNANELMVSHSRNILAFSRSDNKIHIWEFNGLAGIYVGAEHRLITELEGHSKNISSMCFTTDGKFLLSGSIDNTLKLWHIETGDLVKEFNQHITNSVYSISISSEGKAIISSPSEVGGIQVYDIQYWINKYLSAD